MPPASYSSPRREAAAAETRTAILDAARRLFAARGYAAVTVAQIAKEAGVAVPTVYASAGPKTAILGELTRRAESPELVAEMAGRMAAEEEPTVVLRLAVGASRTLHEEHLDVLRILEGAAPWSVEAGEAWAAGLAAHRAACGATVERLVALGALDADAATPATDALVVLLHPRTWITMREDVGLDWDGAEERARRAAARLLLDGPGGA
ncbi:TetR/AcrR family transcriptional regulator [Patulibacter americanus]|uniref:TetR/AcrR family transcriptional regulator n=1 Tax=Patulibacter americanus TaxID=588672 RepID=UPI0003B40CB0|nr:TetR/AcrR family transcriptional regulator [Patulibacter americanus]